MQRVDVLGDDRADEAALLELGERSVAGVRLGVEQHAQPLSVEAPDALGVAAKGVDGRDLERVDVGPDPGRRTEVRDPALGRDAGSREDDARLALADESG
jgi:hypothetical protein